MRTAKHHSKSFKLLRKTLENCNEIVEMRAKKNGMILVASSGETFCHHETSKELKKMRSFLRRNTKIPNDILQKITKS